MVTIIHVLHILLLYLSGSPTVSADVATEAPDLSGFKLRPVNIKVDAELQLGAPIDDIGLAAKLLHEALFVKDQKVHCIAYGHLFYMIHARRADLTHHLPPVEQTTINALAVVAEVDRAIYLHMFLDECHLNGHQLMADLFAEAMEQVDRRRGIEARETWLDLMQCATAHFGTELNDFLRNETRMIQAKGLLEFNSRPIERRPVAKSKPKSLLDWIWGATKVDWKPSIRDLVNKFDGVEPDWRPVLKDELTESRRVIEAGDDAVLAAFRRAAVQSLYEKGRGAPVQDESASWKYNELEQLLANQTTKDTGKSSRKQVAAATRKAPGRSERVLADTTNKPIRAAGSVKEGHRNRPRTGNKENGAPPRSQRANRMKSKPMRVSAGVDTNDIHIENKLAPLDSIEAAETSAKLPAVENERAPDAGEATASNFEFDLPVNSSIAPTGDEQSPPTEAGERVEDDKKVDTDATPGAISTSSVVEISPQEGK